MQASDLRLWLERYELSQGDLAHLLGVHILTVNRWANEAREIPPFLDLALETLERRLRSESKPGRPKKVAGKKKSNRRLRHDVS